ncbi:MAG: hypothetical protein UV63_C0042G0001 [Microgenomates group bacterium GW2011_GWC1_43_11]|uniref:Uncharacterized protein n=2 Tax=Candidatus Gottesmaniibacteriota TaxID=1752720 RepID=A0A0G1LJS9_9BACT|nr:MAG: hypothetical protein UV63_C0042G0001 [Microgenomates group bacterium GW2011_GWC1_43_11]KKT36478.1 MAG: hypothetical protein UW22_C0038G0014 [Candidatus Gottesmanbacteria bacterium GW2011_GWB1_44_11c]KKT60089.1 MAG: hypothetical protein UW52_C0029G0014 [Candidatus Gottesmanbacteria bacterium GW2011_GWA1_44_24b]HCM81838.1 hypothetical protein [Patescibacteria group bacterium]
MENNGPIIICRKEAERIRDEVRKRIEENGKVGAGYAAMLRTAAMEDMFFHKKYGDPEMDFGGGRANGLHKEL